MRRYLLACAFLIAALPALGLAQQDEVGVSAEYRVVNTAKVGGAGSWDYITADVAARRLYIPRGGQGQAARITVFDLDTLKAVGNIPGVNAHAVAIDAKSNHGFATSSPVVMWDTQTLKTIKSINVQGTPDTILSDAFNQRVYVFSDVAPNATVIDAVNGSVLGTIDLGGAPEQAVTDEKGRIYIAIEDKDEIAVIDANSMKVVARYDLDGVGGGPTALALDVKNQVLFVACRNQTMVYVNARDGKFLFALPIGAGVDGVAFNPSTNEIFSVEDEGSLTIAKVTGPTNFAMAGTVFTSVGARAMALDTKTNKVYVVTAEYASPKTPPAPFGQLPQRGAIVPGSFSILTLSK